jgi:hypothetical protein
MTVLLVESFPGVGNQVREHLRRRGIPVAACTDPSSADASASTVESVCHLVAGDGPCPLDATVEQAMLVRVTAGRTLLETGAVCAARHRLPIVEVAPDAGDEEIDEALGAALDRARKEIDERCATAVRAALAPVQVDVIAEHRPDRVSVRLGVPAGGTDVPAWSLVDRARAAVRAFDATVPVIDVSIVAE